MVLGWRVRADLVPVGRLARWRRRAAQVVAAAVAIAIPPVAVVAAIAIAATSAIAGAVAGLALILGRRLIGAAMRAVLWPLLRRWQVTSRDGRAVGAIDVLGPWPVRVRGIWRERARALAVDVGAPTAADVEAAGVEEVARRAELPPAHVLVLAAVARLAETGALEVAIDEVRAWRGARAPGRLVVRRGVAPAQPGTLEAAILADVERQLASLGGGAPIVPEPALPGATTRAERPAAPLRLSARLVPTLAERAAREPLPAGPSPATIAHRLAAIRAAHPALAASAIAAASSLGRVPAVHAGAAAARSRDAVGACRSAAA